jgi:hypothetical protein
MDPLHAANLQRQGDTTLSRNYVTPGGQSHTLGDAMLVYVDHRKNHAANKFNLTSMVSAIFDPDRSQDKGATCVLMRPGVCQAIAHLRSHERMVLHVLDPSGDELLSHSEYELPQQSYLTAVNLAIGNCLLQLNLNSVGVNPALSVLKHLQLASTASTVLEGLRVFLEGEGRADFGLSSPMHAFTSTAHASSISRSQTMILLTFIMRLFYPNARLSFTHLGSQNVENVFRVGRATEQDMDVMGVLRAGERVMAATLPGVFQMPSLSGRLAGQIPVKSGTPEHVAASSGDLMMATALGVVQGTDILRLVGLSSVADEFLSKTAALESAGLLAPAAAHTAAPDQGAAPFPPPAPGNTAPSVPQPREAAASVSVVLVDVPAAPHTNMASPCVDDAADPHAVVGAAAAAAAALSHQSTSCAVLPMAVNSAPPARARTDLLVPAQRLMLTHLTTLWTPWRATGMSTAMMMRTAMEARRCSPRIGAWTLSPRGSPNVCASRCLLLRHQSTRLDFTATK